MLGFIQVKSSMIEALKYDESVFELVVIFTGGQMYKYQDVSPREFDALMKAESLGKHFHKFIRTAKTFEKCAA